VITEVVEIELREGTVDLFMTAAEECRPLFERSPGFIGFEAHQVIERPSTIMILIRWESVAHHMDMFRNSPEYTLWRENVGVYFAGSPRLGHTRTVVRY
jgi:heme-degrading monooxygenase HmoA